MLPDLMPRIAKALGVRGSTIASVRATLLSEGYSEYDIYLSVKGAAITYPHVREVLNEEQIPDTERQT